MVASRQQQRRDHPRFLRQPDGEISHPAVYACRTGSPVARWAHLPGSHFITVLRRSDLEVVSEFGGPGVGSGQLGRPHDLTVDPSGNIFVAEAAGPTMKHPVTGADVEAGFRAQKFTFTGTRPMQ